MASFVQFAYVGALATSTIPASNPVSMSYLEAKESDAPPCTVSGGPVRAAQALFP